VGSVPWKILLPLLLCTYENSSIPAHRCCVSDQQPKCGIFCDCWYVLKKKHLSRHAAVVSLTNSRSVDFFASVGMSLKKTTYPGTPLFCLWPTAEVIPRKEGWVYYFYSARYLFDIKSDATKLSVLMFWPTAEEWNSIHAKALVNSPEKRRTTVVYLSRSLSIFVDKILLNSNRWSWIACSFGYLSVYNLSCW